MRQTLCKTIWSIDSSVLYTLRSKQRGCVQLPPRTKILSGASPVLTMICLPSPCIYPSSNSSTKPTQRETTASTFWVSSHLNSAKHRKTLSIASKGGVTQPFNVTTNGYQISDNTIALWIDKLATSASSMLSQRSEHTISAINSQPYTSTLSFWCGTLLSAITY